MSEDRGIRKRGSTYLVDVTHKDNRATATIAGTLADARAKRAELLLELRAGAGRIVGSKGKGWTLGQAIDYTVSHRWEGTPGARSAVPNIVPGNWQIERTGAIRLSQTSPRLPGVLMAALNETELYAPIKRLLEEQGYTVRAEVDTAIWSRYAAASHPSSSS